MSIDFAANLPPKPEPESGPMAALPSALRSLRSQQLRVVSQLSKRGLMSQRHNAVDRLQISASRRAPADVQKITAEALEGVRTKGARTASDSPAGRSVPTGAILDHPLDAAPDGLCDGALYGFSNYEPRR